MPNRSFGFGLDAAGGAPLYLSARLARATVWAGESQELSSMHKATNPLHAGGFVARSTLGLRLVTNHPGSRGFVTFCTTSDRPPTAPADWQQFVPR